MSVYPNAEYRRVVAGVSSFDARLPMVRWAAAEAAERGAELRLVTACPARGAADRYLPADPADAIRAAAKRRLADVAKYVVAEWPDLWVSTELLDGTPAWVLRAAAASADLLVVGADDATPFSEAITGSVPGELLTTSPCPLVVVPQTERTVDETARVLVALDEPGTSQAALAYAFAAADRSGRPLCVLRCLPSGVHDRTARTDQARALIGFGELFPRVTVTQELVNGDPRNVLARFSRTAALLVLGSRGRGHLASTLFGSVSRNLIRHSGCPVVVAHARPEVEHAHQAL